RRYCRGKPEGSCPVSSMLCPPRPLPPECKSDSDCSGKEKCCTIQCTQLCVKSVKEY
uniref:WAP domain-containing protein n=1 Tax=Leptobrachium leishanense TaxID=445787 RepID=A0A8C5MBE0_9ANUR